MFTANCWRDAFVCVLCLLSVAIVCAVRFAMCKWIVPPIVTTVSSSESLLVVRLAKWLLWAYPLCVKVIVPDVRHWDEGMEIDPHLVGKWLLLPILNVVQIKLCDEVQGI